MYLTDRHKIAYAMNSMKFPVMKINLDSPYMEGHKFYDKGSKCRVCYQSKNYGEMYEECRLTYNGDDGKFELLSGAYGIHSSFGYSDVMEGFERANTPILRAGQEVIVVLDFPNTKMCKVLAMKVGNRVNPHCMTATTLEHLTAEEQKEWESGFRRWFRR